jgi:hypothetical protein
MCVRVLLRERKIISTSHKETSRRAICPVRLFFKATCAQAHHDAIDCESIDSNNNGTEHVV